MAAETEPKTLEQLIAEGTAKRSQDGNITTNVIIEDHLGLRIQAPSITADQLPTIAAKTPSKYIMGEHLSGVGGH